MKNSKWKKLLVMVSAAALLAGCASSKSGAEPGTEKSEPVEVNQKEEMKEGMEVRASFMEDANKTPEASGQGETVETDTETGTENEAEAEEEVEKEDNQAAEEVSDGESKAIGASDGKFDYVAVGNSVTCNEISDLWWGSWGMAATSPEKDYVHILSKWLAGQSDKPVTTTVIDIKKWEVAPDRNAALNDYEKYFSEHTDLVTLQTGENITEGKETLGVDYPELVRRIKEKAPNAQILMLGTVLWSPKEEIENAKKAACEQNGITLIDVSDFRAKYDEKIFRSAEGTQVYGEDGQMHTITVPEVAAHPNDEGMANIAQLFIDHITLFN